MTSRTPRQIEDAIAVLPELEETVMPMPAIYFFSYYIHILALFVLVVFTLLDANVDTFFFDVNRIKRPGSCMWRH
jgi:hypothetical protein